MLNGMGQMKIFFGHPTCIMGVQLNMEGVVNVFPIRMVVLGFCLKGYSRHGGESFLKVLESEGFGKVVFL